LLQRTITGTIFVIILLGSVLFSAYSFAILFFTITILGIWEFYTLAEKTGHQPQRITGILLGAFLFSGTLLNYSTTYGKFALFPIALLLPTLFSIFIIELYRKKEKAFGNIAYTILGVLYIALPFSLFTVIAFGTPVTFSTNSYEPSKILGILFILWSSDTGAYLSGKAFGKHKLFERISPKKTWEGTIGGGILALAVAYIVSIYFTGFNVMDWMIIALIIVILGNLGDLVESLFKRTIDVKDSGTILPGHGGILDRFDSLIISIPFIFIYIFFISTL